MIRKPKLSTPERVYRPAGPDIALVDGMNMAFKVIFTLGTLSYRGQNTTIQYGVLNMLRAFIAELWPRGVIFVLDGKGGKKRRQAIYPEYKANRVDKHKEFDWDSIFAQLHSLVAMLPSFGIGTIEIPGYEADDVIAELTRKLTWEAGKSVTIVSSDKDLYQLVSPNASIYPGSGKPLLTLSTFSEVLGVSPERYIEYRCLTGDSSDNIIGLAGIGPKTAGSLLEKMSLEQALSVQHTGRLAVLNEAGSVEILARNKRLIDLAEFPIPTEEWRSALVLPDRAEKETMKQLLDDLGFFSMLDKFAEFSTPFVSLRTKDEVEGRGP